MTATLEEVKAAATALAVHEQIELLEHLDEITAEEREEIRKAWKEESKRRFAELASGAVEGVPFEKLFSRSRVAKNAAD